MKEVIIDGTQITDLTTFYDEIEKKLTRSLSWNMGRNLDAFNDILRGGFGVHEYAESLRLIWENADLSRNALGWNETIVYIQKIMETCHPSNLPELKKRLKNAKNQKGETLFDSILEIIAEHDHIELQLK
jgi:RNAse (barnase) inhibitor barstar